ncbi:MAG: hypothetical protein J7601_11980, partial [Chloroflexi bacterium]|nr:hypothetical protein [Chloroflexota bacterium]
MSEPVYIWRSGLRHWESRGEGFVALPDGRFIGPRPPSAPVELIDADIYSGATMLKLARALRAAGCPPERISVELGPILPDTVDDAVAIARVLADEGLVSYLTYRGASIGQYGDYSAAIA